MTYVRHSYTVKWWVHVLGLTSALLLFTESVPAWLRILAAVATVLWILALVALWHERRQEQQRYEAHLDPMIRGVSRGDPPGRSDATEHSFADDDARHAQPQARGLKHPGVPPDASIYVKEGWDQGYSPGAEEETVTPQSESKAGARKPIFFRGLMSLPDYLNSVWSNSVQQPDSFSTLMAEATKPTPDYEQALVDKLLADNGRLLRALAQWMLETPDGERAVRLFFDEIKRFIDRFDAALHDSQMRTRDELRRSPDFAKWLAETEAGRGILSSWKRHSGESEALEDVAAVIRLVHRDSFWRWWFGRVNHQGSDLWSLHRIGKLKAELDEFVQEIRAIMKYQQSRAHDDLKSGAESGAAIVTVATPIDARLLRRLRAFGRGDDVKTCENRRNDHELGELVRSIITSNPAAFVAFRDLMCIRTALGSGERILNGFGMECGASWEAEAPIVIHLRRGFESPTSFVHVLSDLGQGSPEIWEQAQ
jgi:hypothetical protein